MLFLNTSLFTLMFELYPNSFRMTLETLCSFDWNNKKIFFKVLKNFSVKSEVLRKSNSSLRWAIWFVWPSSITIEFHYRFTISKINVQETYNLFIYQLSSIRCSAKGILESTCFGSSSTFLFLGAGPHSSDGRFNFKILCQKEPSEW